MPGNQPANDLQRQLQLSFHIPVVMVAQPDGKVLVSPGRPVERLTPAEFAKRVGLSRDSIYRYVGQAELPERFVVYAGKRKMLILADAVAHFLETSRTARGFGDAASGKGLH